MVTLTLQEKTKTEVRLDTSVSVLIESLHMKGDNLIIKTVKHPASYLLIDKISDIFSCDQTEVIENFQKDRQLILSDVNYRTENKFVVLYRKEYSITVS